MRDKKCDMRNCGEDAVGEAVIRGKRRPVCEHHIKVYERTADYYGEDTGAIDAAYEPILEGDTLFDERGLVKGEFRVFKSQSGGWMVRPLKYSQPKTTDGHLFDPDVHPKIEDVDSMVQGLGRFLERCSKPMRKEV